MTTAEQTISNELLFAHVSIKISGAAISTDMMSDLLDVEVQQTLHEPSMFTVRFYNPDLKWTGNASFAVAKEVEIGMSQSQTTVSVFKGEITVVEYSFNPATLNIITIRGFDKRHRLTRGRKTRTFLQMSDSDMLSSLAGEAGLSGSGGDTTVHDYVLQNNESNYEFLQRRAYRMGQELMLDGAILKMRPKGTPADTVEIEYGINLVELSLRDSSHYQVDEVIVRGWDPKTKQAIVGTASGSSGNTFGTAKVASVYRSVTTQGEAQKVAAGILEDLKERKIQLEGTCFGEPRIVAGKNIKLKSLGTTYSVKYYVTACTHTYNSSGYYTHFEANGKQTNSLYELTGRHPEQPDKITGNIIGIVTDNKDPDGKQGRVKVKFPTLPQNNGTDIESNWARIVSPMAGLERGFFFLPEVNDEVLVAFENGDLNRPYVLGGVWNGTDKQVKASSAAVGGDGKVKERILKTTSGHIVTFNDSPDAPGISIVDKTTKNKIVIDSTANSITIESDGAIAIKAKNAIDVESTTNNITLKAASGMIKFQAKDVVIESTVDTKIKATANVGIEATANVNVKGTAGVTVEATAMLGLKGTAGAKLESPAITEVKGSLLKLN